MSDELVVASERVALEPVVPDQIWVSERSLWFSGVRLRARTTIVRLPSGQLWIHSPGVPTDAMCRALHELGDVAWIVIPNRFHHLQAVQTKARFPKACLVGPESVRSRNSGVQLDRVFSPSRPENATSEIVAVPMRGIPFLDETLFVHEPTESLVCTDLVMCGSAGDHFTWRWVSRVCGQYQRYLAPPDVRLRTRANPLVMESLRDLDRFRIARVFVAHSDPITERPLEQLKDALRFASK